MDEPQDKFISSSFPWTLQEKLKSMRETGKFCDFTIKVDSEDFKVHKLLLALTSDYFSAMFTYDSTESQNNEVHLDEISAEIMRHILDFCYTSCIHIEEENVQEILIAASRLQIRPIQDLCVDFISHRVDETNCLNIYTMAFQCNLKNLYTSTFDYCLENFLELIDGPEFSDISGDLLIQLVSNDRLNVDAEVDVVSAILSWYSSDPERRIHKLDDILCNVRFPLLSPIDLISISSNPIVQKLPRCCQLINEAKDYILLREYPERRSLMEGERFKVRSTLKNQQRIYAVGGWTNESKALATAEVYNPYNDSWTEIEPMSKPRCGAGVVTFGDYIYAIGGHDGHNNLKSVERYDTVTKQWLEDVSDMQVERTSVGVVALHGYIYAIGGQSRSCHALDVVERYDPRKNVWEYRAPLQQKRLGAGVTVLNNFIYAVGGASNGTLGSVERYDPDKNEWTLVASMNMNRKHLGCTAIDDKIILAVGGRSDSSELDSVESYDPILNSWTTMPKMSIRRSGIGLVELEGCIYAVGGISGDKQLTLVEAYDCKKEIWIKKQSLIHERLGGGLAVFSKLRNHRKHHAVEVVSN